MFRPFFIHLQGGIQPKNAVMTRLLFFFVITVYFSVEYLPEEGRNMYISAFLYIIVSNYSAGFAMYQTFAYFFQTILFLIRDDGPAYAETCAACHSTAVLIH
jgi:hypothetical protein